jgi:HD-like signal output (HDOD) protein/ActR/RegA family two-component response regulator
MRRILFVDDEHQVRQGLRSSLYGRRHDWDMKFAEGGAQAMQWMKESLFDVLVTDLRMPGVNGTALVAHARTHSPSTIRIVLSGYVDDEQSHRLVSLAHRYLSKPCESKKLEDCIGRCLATRDLIHSATLRARLGTITELPAMPSTFAALQQALLDPLVDSMKVAAIIERDPAVSAKVLQVCNSSFFRLPRRVSRITEAVSYLGLSTVRSMALSAELFRPGEALSAGLDLGLMQRHALNVGAIARSLAAGADWAEDAFLAGLLHDVGFLLLGRQYRAELQGALEAAAAGMPLSDAEALHVGVDHGHAGAYLLGLWGLPYEVVEAVAEHDAVPPVAPAEFSPLSAVKVSQALLAAVRPQDVPAYESDGSELPEGYLQAVGLSHTWEELVQRADALVNPKEGL